MTWMQEVQRMQLANKVAVITGGASGQGQAACRLFAQAGARVVVADWNGTGAEQTAEEIRAAGGEAVAVPADISREADAEVMIQKALDQFGRLDILFNNAGVGYSSSDRFKMANVVETPEHAWDAILAINLKGAALACKHAIPAMAAQGAGAAGSGAARRRRPLLGNACRSCVRGTVPCRYRGSRAALRLLLPEPPHRRASRRLGRDPNIRRHLALHDLAGFRLAHDAADQAHDVHALVDDREVQGRIFHGDGAAAVPDPGHGRRWRLDQGGHFFQG